MFYLKTGYHFSDHCEVAEITPMNIFATCCVCGRETHLRANDVITSIRELMLGTYQCPECQEVYDKLVQDITHHRPPFHDDCLPPTDVRMGNSNYGGNSTHRRRRRAESYAAAYDINNVPDSDTTTMHFMEEEE